MVACLRHFHTWEFEGGVSVRHYPVAGYTETVFADGAKVPAVPHETHDYRRRARLMGYRRDTARMSFEHEFLHVMLAALEGRVSRVMWDLAHGLPADGPEHHAEEELVMAFQQFFRGRGDCREAVWSKWAGEARRYLGDNFR